MMTKTDYLSLAVALLAAGHFMQGLMIANLRDLVRELKREARR